MINAVKMVTRVIPKFRKKSFIQKEPRKLRENVTPIFQYPVSKYDRNRIYVWGLAEHGALGTLVRTALAENAAYIGKPSRSIFGEKHKVHNIASGYGFTVFAVKEDKDGIVYGCGINTDSQIGYHPKDKKYSNDLIIEPRPIPLPLQNKSEKVVDLAAGRAHLLILTNEGLYTLGNNGYGQCGRRIVHNEDYSHSNVVHYIPNIEGQRIIAVTAGQDHSMVLTEKGEVYTFGWGADGQTGLAHFHNESNPGLVKGDLSGEKVIKVACSADCVLALSEKGKVYGWGNSEYSQLPTNNETCQLNVATEIKMCQNVGCITDIAAGGTFCMVLNNSGEVYVWGYGILGFGPEVTRVKKPTLIPPTLFGRNEFQPQTRVTSIACGINHMAAITNSGDLYMWGRNKFGSLGFGHLKDQPFPLKVPLSAQVKKITCGVDHNVALCKPFI